MFSKTCLEKACLRCFGSNHNKSESFSKNNVFLLSIYLFLPLVHMTVFTPFSQILSEKECRFYYYRLDQTAEIALAWLIFNQNEE